MTDNGSPSNPHPLVPPDDARLTPYRLLNPKVRDEPETVFVAESEKIVRRLWASDYRCDTVLVSEKKLARIADDIPAGVDVLVVSEETMKDVLGFKFHSGVMATGVRRAFASVSDWLATKPPPGVLLVLPELTDPLNLGAILRNAAAFGVTGVLFGPHCRDPFSRQSIRTSMGTIFSLPLCRSADVIADLKSLRDAGYESWATVLGRVRQPLADRGPAGPRGVARRQ